MNAADPIVCYTFFTDGTQRPVFEDTIGQYVLVDDGEPIRGLWYIAPEADMPVIVEQNAAEAGRSYRGILCEQDGPFGSCTE